MLSGIILKTERWVVLQNARSTKEKKMILHLLLIIALVLRQIYQVNGGIGQREAIFLSS